MPLIFIHHPQGSFTPEALDALAQQVSKDGGDLEKLADDPFVRSTTWVYAHEYDPAHVYHGGKPGGTKVITVELNALQGGFDAATKAELIKRVTAAVAEAAGLQGDILPIYVVLRDVPEQNWGFSGKPLSFDQLQKPPPGAMPL